MNHLPDRTENERKLALKRARYRRHYYARGRARRQEQQQSPEWKAKRRAYDNAPANALKRKARRLMERYGITEDQYQKMMLLQGGRCVICGHPPKKMRLAVEHDHATKRVRGLACFKCNKYVIGRNTVETAKMLVEYLSSDFDGRTL